MSTTAAITELWRYPVKSLQGERVDHTEITDVIPGDRGWGVVAIDTGELLSAKRVPQLLEGAARLDGHDRCVLTLPQGEIGSDDAAADEALSTWLDRDVRLARPTPGESATIGIDWDEGQAELPDELPVFEFPTQPGWFFDSTSSLHLIGTATLDTLDAEVGAGAGDVRRFRPNLVVETTDAWFEDHWVDETLSIGTATAWVKKRTDRCVVITRAQPGFEASRDTLVHLARTHGRDAGISLQPRSPGSVAVGDTITVTS